eukprot:scaffold182407_cov22-Prasinocladus_malaysianus.AAC.1
MDVPSHMEVMYSDVSQYSMGANSACTGRAVTLWKLPIAPMMHNLTSYISIINPTTSTVQLAEHDVTFRFELC